MIDSAIRKVRQFANDPVLRRWLVGRLTGRAGGPPRFTAHRPPYLRGLSPTKTETPSPPEPFHPLAAGTPETPIDLPLPGLRLNLMPGDERGIFGRAFEDIETLLALHRFAWVPLAGNEVSATWVQALWNEWRARFARADDSAAWHPYTAAERAINILDLGRFKGLPEPVDDTTDILARHVAAIYRRLEYFGDHDTSNHLSNNGRGLYRLGLALGMNQATEAGARILEEEAKRLLMPSGMLREGSSHYHLLIARNYVDAWLAARHSDRPEESMLHDIARRVLAAVPWLVLPGGLPLVGDVSPDCPPEYLLGLAGAKIGWVGRLSKDDRRALLDLIADTPAAGEEALLADGWLRFGYGPWAGLWHCPSGGWSPMPGHGHQDTGSFELHYEDLPVFIDPGRGRYGETGDAALYRSGRVHNTILVDGHDPFPPNKPYYDDGFRAFVAGPAPELRAEGGDEVMLTHHGFKRLGDVEAAHRRWRFSENGMTVTDTVAGRGQRRVTRVFVTPLDAGPGSAGVVLEGRGRTFHLHAPTGVARVEPVTLWQAYGTGRPGNQIVIEDETSLPWSGDVRLEVL